MELLENVETIKTAIYLVIPGIIILYFRSIMTSGKFQVNSEAILLYFALSLFYWALAFPVLGYLDTRPEKIYQSGWMVLPFIFFIPAICGLALGWLTQKDAAGKILSWFRIYKPHPTGTAWDYKFSTGKAYYIEVLTKDDVVIPGAYIRGNGKNDTSFVSTNSEERDILFYEREYDETTKESITTERQIWISKDEIKRITFHKE